MAATMTHYLRERSCFASQILKIQIKVIHVSMPTKAMIQGLIKTLCSLYSGPDIIDNDQGTNFTSQNTRCWALK